MIVVKIELWPGGFEDKKQEIGRAHISNTGELGSGEFGNYNVKLFKSAKYSSRAGEVYKEGKITGFRRQMGPYDLVACCLTWVLGPDRVKRWGKK